MSSNCHNHGNQLPKLNWATTIGKISCSHPSATDRCHVDSRLVLTGLFATMPNTTESKPSKHSEHTQNHAQLAPRAATCKQQLARKQRRYNATHRSCDARRLADVSRCTQCASINQQTNSNVKRAANGKRFATCDRRMRMHMLCAGFVFV